MEKKFILILFLFQVVYSQEHGEKVIHKIPFLSSNNVVELLINNLTDETLMNILVKVYDTPEWIRFKVTEEKIPELMPKKEYLITFVFSLGKEAVIGEEKVIKFLITYPGGTAITKEILIIVTLPDKYELHQNYPNPFNSSSTITYQIPNKSFVVIKIFDILGREIAVLVNDYKEAGYYEVSWDATNVPSGIYFYKMQAGSFTSVKKMVVMR